MNMYCPIFLSLIFASRRHSDMSPEMTILCFVVTVIALIVYAIYQNIDKKKRAEAQRKLDQWNYEKYREWRYKIQQTNQLQPVACSLLLKKGEECLYVAHNVTLSEVRAVRHSTHTFGSIPIGNSRIRIGRGYSTSSSTDEWTQIAIGTLYITDKQIYFDGDKQDRRVPLDKLVSLNADYSIIEISSETRQKSMVFSNCNGYIIRDTIKILSNMD